MRISKTKTEDLGLNGGEGTMKLQEIELVRAKHLKYLEFSIPKNGECESEFIKGAHNAEVSCRATRLDKNRNEYIKKTARVVRIGKQLKDSRLK